MRIGFGGLGIGLGSQATGGFVVTNKASYSTVETITVTFAGSTTAHDWLNIVSVGSPYNTITTWIYCGTGNQVAGALLASGSWPMGPLGAGTYEVRFLANDGFTVIATSSPFTVT